ncbi:MAG: hypothetical protein ACHQET_01365 [Chitinophagales bacterium]
MRFLKLVLISILVFFIILTFLFSLFPSNIRISRVIQIQSSKEKIMATIGNLETWKDWNLLIYNSGLRNIRIPDPPLGRGASLHSDQLTVTVEEMNADSLVTRWSKSNERKFRGGFYLVQSDESVTLQWYFDFHFHWYPWEKLGALFYDKRFGFVMEKSLVELKTYVEKIR